MSAVGEKQYIVWFDDALEKECYSKRLRMEKLMRQVILMLSNHGLQLVTRILN
ncbi:MAG: hypothetical protein ACK53Y_13320 [bacterium]